MIKINDWTAVQFDNGWTVRRPDDILHEWYRWFPTKLDAIRFINNQILMDL
jgi:hypothetical protein